MRRIRPIWPWLVIAVVPALLVGCSLFGGDENEQPSLEGFRVHDAHPGGGADAIVSGVVEIDQETGCVWLSDTTGGRAPVVWPLGTRVESEQTGIRLRDGEVLRPGDQVEGGGGYVDANAATSGSGLEPFPDDCVQVGEAAVFNADSSITVTHGVGLDVEETLVGRFSSPQPIGLQLIAVGPGRSVALVDFVTGTVHRYRPGQYEAPGDSIDGASGGGGFIHLWSNGRIWTYWPLDSAPLSYQPDRLRETPGTASTLQVLPGPDGDHTWLVQPGGDSEGTLIELVNVVGFQLSREMSTEIEGQWRPVGATIDGLILVSEAPDPQTRLVSKDGAVTADLHGTALSVGWNGVAIVSPDGLLVITDGQLGDPIEVGKPEDGAWAPIGGPLVPSTSPPLRTATDRFIVMVASEPAKGAVSAGHLVVVDSDGNDNAIYELTEGSHVATWSPHDDWVVVAEDTSVTLISLDDGSTTSLGDIIPEEHWVLSAG
jgi:hypothetical protein